MKFLIDKCVPLNNGDAALIFSLKRQLENKGDVSFVTTHYNTTKTNYPNENWSKSLLDYKYYRTLFSKLPIIAKVITFIYIVFMNNPYKDADYIIAAPGGYIHSYYGIEDKLYIWYLCKKYLKKNVGIYSNSISDLEDRDRKLLRKYGSMLDYIYLRDYKSFVRAKEYGLGDNIKQTKDAAFMLKEVKINHSKSRNNKVAISVRSWKNENRNMDCYYKIIENIVSHLLSLGYEVEFFSTCQGLENYVDDSKVALDIVDRLGLKENSQVSVNTEYHDLNSFQNKIKEFDFVVGTRLHMCILSLINNVPAFNISYEEKGIEAYKYLGIERFSIDFNETEDFLNQFNEFINLTDNQLKNLWLKISHIQKEQVEILNKVL